MKLDISSNTYLVDSKLLMMKEIFSWFDWLHCASLTEIFDKAVESVKQDQIPVYMQADLALILREENPWSLTAG